MFLDDESSGLAKLMGKVATLTSGGGEIYMEMEDYDFIEDGVYQFAWQYRRGTLSDGRVTLMFKLLPGDMKWYWMRHSISHPAKMSVLMVETVDGMVDTNGGKFEEMVTNIEFKAPSKKVLAGVLSAVEFKELKAQLSVKEEELKQMSQVALTVGMHSPSIAEEVLKRVPIYKSEIEILKIAMAGKKGNVEDEKIVVLSDPGSTAHGVCKICGRDTTVFVLLAICEECEKNKYAPMNFLDNIHKSYDPSKLKNYGAGEDDDDDDDDDGEGKDDYESNHYDDSGMPEFESMNVPYGSDGLVPSPSFDSDFLVTSTNEIKLCHNCHTVLEKDSQSNSCANCTDVCLICGDPVYTGVKICGACGEGVTTHPAFDKLPVGCDFCVKALYNYVSWKTPIKECAICGNIPGKDYACVSCGVIQIPGSTGYSKLCKICLSEVDKMANAVDYNVSDTLPGGSKHGSSGDSKHSSDKGSMNLMIGLLENCLACDKKLVPTELVSLKALCSKCIQKHIHL